MVFHITNFMRETNVWMIRKMRWLLWGFVLCVPFYRNTYWDYLGRRVAFRETYGLFNLKDEAAKKEYNESMRAYWGYKPRYEPVYDFSLKAQKYEGQTDEEKLNDHPRLNPKGLMTNKRYKVDPKDVRTFVQVAMEHNRSPGDFDYNYPQNFYSTFPEIDQESYLVVGDRQTHYAHVSYQDGKVHSQ